MMRRPSGRGQRSSWRRCPCGRASAALEAALDVGNLLPAEGEDARRGVHGIRAIQVVGLVSVWYGRPAVVDRAAEEIPFLVLLHRGVEFVLREEVVGARRLGLAGLVGRGNVFGLP